MKALHRSHLTLLSPAERTVFLSFKASAWEDSPIHEPFASRTGKGGVTLTSAHWRHSSGSVGRCALIASERIEILNLMVFPANASQVPIFASEIILFGGKISVAVVDWQMASGPTALPDQDRSILTRLHASWTPALTPGGTFPDWAQAHFTPFCLYTRPQSAKETQSIQDAFTHYFQTWLNQCAPRLAPESVPTENHLDSYLHHHVEHTPGRPFLTKVFGSDWAEAYFRSFMYAPIGFDPIYMKPSESSSLPVLRPAFAKHGNPLTV
ncbi:MAG: hypothetical protein SNJ84_01570 [Verrucomicrobiia bacterium]